MHQIRRLDLNIAYACNLACKGCLSLSDFDRKGVMPYDAIVDSINTWKSKVYPKTTSIFGGEPLLHPRLTDIFSEVRKAWPDTTIRLITNGYLLNKKKVGNFFEHAPFEHHDRVQRQQEAPETNWATLELGQLQLPKGKAEVQLKALSITGTKTIELKNIRLTRKEESS